MIDKFHLGEPYSTGNTHGCSFIGDDDLLSVVEKSQDVQSTRWGADGVTLRIRFKPDVEVETAWLRLYYALETRIQERKAEFHQQ